MNEIKRLTEGFQQFQQSYLTTKHDLVEHLKQGQSPKTMVIACSDSRLDPAILTNSALGDIFVIRNIANLVEPFDNQNTSHNAVGAALEYAVCNLEVEHIIILGHSSCGGVGALMNGYQHDNAEGQINNWISIANCVREETFKKHGNKDKKELSTFAEQAAIKLSVNNLETYPFIKKRLHEKKLSLHGWYFDLNHFGLLEYDSEHNSFRQIN